MTSPQQTDAWQFPIAEIVAKHRERIDNENFIPTVIETWHEREDFPSWIVWIAGGNDKVQPRDASLYAIDIMARATACDYLVYAFDTHMSQHQVNPTTGKPWAPGEMQRMCDEEGYCDTGNIRDNLCVAIIRRSDAKLYFHSIPYHFHKGELILYDDESVFNEWEDGEGRMEGRIPDVLREAVTGPTIMQSMHDKLGIDQDMFGLDARTARLHTMFAGVRVLSDAAVKCEMPNLYIHALSAASEEEAKLIEESAERTGITLGVA